MLKAALKGSEQGGISLHSDDDRMLRRAFGRYGGGAGARSAAAPIVARYQQSEGGHWFVCDCHTRLGRWPVLVPVAQTHVRRHQDERWPGHDEECDFYREPGEQRLLTASYGPLPSNRPMRLIRRLDQTAAAPPQGTIEATSYQRRRPGIARLLIQLATAAGLQRLGPGEAIGSLPDQVKALWQAAKEVELDDGTMLPDFLCTSPARLGELVARLERIPAARFPHSRPHGVLIARIASIGPKTLHPVAGEPITVAGRLGVFGETAGDRRASQGERTARAPYLAACVVARARSDGPFEVMSAYAHPCAADGHLMLVDSDLERRTLVQLRSVQSWLLNKQDIAVSIEKPMADIGPAADGDADPRPPCIPDFVVRLVSRPSGKEGQAAVVETMGFASEEYRARKERLHPLMAEALGGAAVVQHDFHEPREMPQAERDKAFWQEVRRGVTRSPQSRSANPATGKKAQ